jgi:hypothetical protein
LSNSAVAASIACPCLSPMASRFPRGVRDLDFLAVLEPLPAGENGILELQKIEHAFMSASCITFLKSSQEAAFKHGTWVA